MDICIFCDDYRVYIGVEGGLPVSNQPLSYSSSGILINANLSLWIPYYRFDDLWLLDWAVIITFWLGASLNYWHFFGDFAGFARL